MNIVHCEKCGGYTPEGFALCPACIREAGAGEEEAKAVEDLLEVVNVLNIGDTEESRKAAIQSILNIAGKLEGKAHEAETEKEA